MYCDTVMTFVSLSWKCYWHSNDLLHVPVDYRAICQHFISLSINLSPASQAFRGWNLNKYSTQLLFNFCFHLQLLSQPVLARRRLSMTDAALDRPGSPGAPCEAGKRRFSFYRFAIAHCGNMFQSWVGQAGNPLHVWTLSLGFPKWPFGACWHKRKWLTSQGAVIMS